MALDGLPVRIATRVLGVTESGYFTWRSRPPSARSFRHSWLTEVITAIHAASGATYGYRRIHEELTLRYGVSVSHGTVQLLMRRAGIHGVSGDKRRGIHGDGGVPLAATGLLGEAGSRAPDAP